MELLATEMSLTKQCKGKEMGRAFLILVLFFAGACSVYERDKVGGSGPVGWWRFDEGGGIIVRNSGSGGNKFDGKCNNMDESNRVAGIRGPGALAFDGVEEDVEVGAVNLYSNTVTITAWVKREGELASYAGIVFCRDGDTIAGIGGGSTGEPDWKANHELYYGWNDDEATWAWHSGLIIPEGKWVFVGLVLEEERARLYLGEDGVLDSATNETAHDIEEFNGMLRIGNDKKPGQAPRFFRGCIDDVRVYNRALTEAEIRELLK